MLFIVRLSFRAVMRRFPRFLTASSRYAYSLKKDHDIVVTLEDGILNGGFGEKIARFYGDSDMKVLNYGLKKEFIDRYDVKEILLENHLTAEQIADDVMQVEQKR